ncbi:hypothetical protein [uncultured Amphritea sp.]|uniref:hypothetical protein n=1 Tax=uncultured Amphritea sp. TaxID=981605 RepID=UPI00262498DC|nr:hypothetical protein [uncultured Amphritea sp.]
MNKATVNSMTRLIESLTEESQDTTWVASTLIESLITAFETKGFDFNQALENAQNNLALSHQLAPLDQAIAPDEWLSIYKEKGWTQEQLADRWGYKKASGGRRIRQIKANPGHQPHFIDAVFGLPVKKKKDILEMEVMTREQFKAIYKAKGWTQETLAKRWGFSDGAHIRSTLTNSFRPHFMDAVRGLPDLKQYA